MKRSLALAATLASLVSHADTWHQLTGQIGANFTFEVPTNTICTVREIRSLGGRRDFPPVFQARYPAFPGYGDGLKPGERVLGPATLESTLSPFLQEWAGDVLLVLVTLESVNASASGSDPGSAAVHPSGVAAAVKLETSVDLRTWTEAQPGPVPAGATNRFYRATVVFQP